MVTSTQSTPDSAEAARPRFALVPVAGTAVVIGIILLIGSRNYGYFFDEAYFVVAGHDHPAWGYFDQPPLVPMLAGLAQHLFPGSLLLLRLPATLAAVGGVVLTGLIARDLGGRRPAQVLAALAYAMSGAVRITHWLATYSLDPFFWTLILFLVVRWTTGRQQGKADDRLLLIAGAVTALSLQTKFLVPALWFALAATSLIFGPRDLLKRPLLWAGALLAVLATVPTLVWEATHGWPYTHMQQVVEAEFPGYGSYFWEGLMAAGLFAGVPLFLIGVGCLVFAPSMAPYRFVGASVVVVILAFAVMSGRSYYVFSLYAAPLAAGAVGLQKIRWHWALKWLGGLVMVVSVADTLLSVSIYPKSVAEKLPDVPTVVSAKTFTQADGLLPPLAAEVDQIYQSLPPDVREHTAVLTDSYAFAAGIDMYGRSGGISRAYSGHRAYYYFGAPPEEDTNVLFIGTQNPALKGACASSQPIAPDFAGLYLGRTESWEQLWPKLRAQ